MKIKNLFLITVLIFVICIQAISQTPQKFKYQGICRDNLGVVVQNQSVNVRLSIHDLIATGTIAYQETFSIVTNQFGLITLDVGDGVVQQGVFSTISWQTGDKFLEIEMDLGSGYISMGTTQLLSVPYALHSKTAESITGAITETDPVFVTSPANGIANNDITNWNTVYGWGNHSTAGYLVSEVDGSVTNEIQTLSISNDTIYLSNGGFAKLPAGFNGQYNSLTGTPTNVSHFINDAGYLTSFTEVDGSITNELQLLSISNDTIRLSNGGFVKLPAGFNGQYSSLTGAPANVSAFTNDAGYLTSFTEVDGSVTNELQLLSISNDTIRLSNGGFVKLPAGFNGQYSSLTGAPTNVSAFTNDAGYLTSFTEVDGSVTNEIQVLSISNDTIYLSNGGFVKLPNTNAWSLNGNAGTIDGTNFIGTKDNVALNFKVNNQKSGRIDPLGTTFYGYQAGNVDAGSANTGFGIQTLFSNTSGNYNTAIGNWALTSNETGNHNTAVGKAAMLTNISGHENTAVGLQAMYFSTSGYRNVALGYDALLYNVSGAYNVAVGTKSGENNLGSGNVFLGYQAGFNETGSNKLYIANSSSNPPLIYGDFSTGNVGLGTTSPAVKLDVRGNAKFGATGMINIWEWDAIEKIGLDYNPGNGDFNMRNPVAGKRLLGTITPTGSWGIETIGGNEMVRVTGSGNMGIGTTNPGSILQLEKTGSSTGPVLTLSNPTAQASGIDSPTSAIDFKGWASASQPIQFRIQAIDDGNYSNHLAFISKGQSSGGVLTEKMRISSTGNVGIGTSTPNARLDLGLGYGASGEKLIIYNDNTSGPLAGTKTGFYLDRFSLQNNVTFVFPTAPAFPGSYIIARKNTAGTTLEPLMTILGESGNLGIGITSPTSLLHVNTTSTADDLTLAKFFSALDGDYEDNNIFIGKSLGAGQSAVFGYIYNTNINNTGAYMTVWGDTPGSTGLFVRKGGNVGVATTTPTARLHVKGGIVAGQPGKIKIEDADPTGLSSLELINNAGNTFYFYKLSSGYPANGRYTQGVSMIESNNANGLTLSEVTGDMHFYTGGNNERLTIKNSGNIGIGTSNPSEQLEVNGNLKVSGSIYSPGMVVQTIVKTSDLPSSLNVTTYTEANTDYRISFTPKFNNSIILVEYSFPINTAMASNTVFDMQLIRDIGGTEVLVGVGPVNGSRQQVSFVGRPGNGTDGNDRMTVIMTAKDSGLTSGTSYIYGFKYRRETGGSGTCYFNSSNLDSNVYGFSGIMTMKITEIAQ
ncbi:MAG: hypothetical protein HY951_19310 [Bacteroidia bacterium]|nr:hypothetical protein [Bacteroidia bacterium]